MWRHRHLGIALTAALFALAGAAGCAQAVPGSAQLRPPAGPGVAPTPGARAQRSSTPAPVPSLAPARPGSPPTRPASGPPSPVSGASALPPVPPGPTATGSGGILGGRPPAASSTAGAPTGTTPTASTPTSTTPTGATPTAATPPPPPAPAGSDPFSGRRIVAYYGAPGSAGLGVLGAGTPAQAWAALDSQAAPYDAPGRPAVRCFELIATVASDTPGAGGEYRNRVSAAAIAPYLQTVRAHGGVLLLDIQPGRSDFLDEAEALEPWLSQPDVGLALDPEWRMGPDQIPGQVIGSVGADEVNSVSAWLEQLTVADHLPDKLFVVHEFTPPELRDEADLDSQQHLHEILNVDGFGSIPVKLAVFHRLARPSPFAMGLKLFYRQDPVLLSPAQVLAVRPAVQLVDYE